MEGKGKREGQTERWRRTVRMLWDLSSSTSVQTWRFFVSRMLIEPVMKVST